MLISKLYRYIFFGFLKYLFIIHAFFFILIFLLAFAEMFRKYHFLDILVIIFLSLLKIPETFIELPSFLILFATFFYIRSLQNTRELDVMRSLGLSMWKLIIPINVIVVIISFFYSVIFADITAKSLLKYKQIIEFYTVNAKSNNKEVSSLWLIKETDDITEIFFFSKSAKKKMLKDIFYVKFDDTSNSTEYFVNGILKDNNIIVDNLNNIDSVDNKYPPSVTHKSIAIDINNKFNKIYDDPKMFSLINLYKLINFLDKFKLNSQKYKIYFYDSLFLVISLLAMTYFATSLAIFNVRNTTLLKSVIIIVLFGAVTRILNNFILSLAVFDFINAGLVIFLYKIFLLFISIKILLYKQGI